MAGASWGFGRTPYMSPMKRLKLVKKRASLSTYFSLWGSLVYLGGLLGPVVISSAPGGLGNMH